MRKHTSYHVFFLNLDLDFFNNYQWVDLEVFVHKKSCHRNCQTFDFRRPPSPTRRLTKPSWRRPKAGDGAPSKIGYIQGTYKGHNEGVECSLCNLYLSNESGKWFGISFFYFIFFCTLLSLVNIIEAKSGDRLVGCDTRSDVNQNMFVLFFRTDVERPCCICVFFKSHVNKRWWIVS